MSYLTDSLGASPTTVADMVMRVLAAPMDDDDRAEMRGILARAFHARYTQAGLLAACEGAQRALGIHGPRKEHGCRSCRETWDLIRAALAAAAKEPA